MCTLPGYKIGILFLSLMVFQGFSYAAPTCENIGTLCDPGESDSIGPLAAYKYVYSFKEGRAIVVIDKKYGFIDKKGNYVIPCQFDYAYGFINGYARVKYGEKFAFIDTSGKTLTSFKYDFVSDFQNGRALVKFNLKWGFIDEKGVEIIPIIYDQANGFEDQELTTVEEKGHWFIIDKMNNRKPVLHTATGIGAFNEGLTYLWMEGKCGIMDKQGNLVVPLKYDNIFYFREGLALVELNGKRGFINKKGQEVVPLVYDGFPGFKEGLAAVSVGENFGFIDKKGKMVVPPKYKSVYSFYDGLARVRIGNKLGCINHKGELVIPAVYDEINVGEGVLGVIADKKGQFLDLTGKTLFPEVYENLYGFSDGAALVKKNGYWLFIDKQGHQLF